MSAIAAFGFSLKHLSRRPLLAAVRWLASYLANAKYDLERATI
jgi:hypothetical protein